MRAIYDLEIRHETLPQTPLPALPTPPSPLRALLSVLPLPLAFGALLVGWPLAAPAPWWVGWGLVWFAGGARGLPSADILENCVTGSSGG